MHHRRTCFAREGPQVWRCHHRQPPGAGGMRKNTHSVIPPARPRRIARDNRTRSLCPVRSADCTNRLRAASVRDPIDAGCRRPETPPALSSLLRHWRTFPQSLRSSGYGTHHRLSSQPQHHDGGRTRQSCHPDRSGTDRTIPSRTQRSGGTTSHTPPPVIPTAAAQSERFHPRRSAAEGPRRPNAGTILMLVLTHGAHSPHPCVPLGTAPVSTPLVPHHARWSWPPLWRSNARQERLPLPKPRANAEEMQVKCGLAEPSECPE